MSDKTQYEKLLQLDKEKYEISSKKEEQEIKQKNENVLQSENLNDTRKKVDNNALNTENLPKTAVLTTEEFEKKLQKSGGPGQNAEKKDEPSNIVKTALTKEDVSKTINKTSQIVADNLMKLNQKEKIKETKDTKFLKKNMPADKLLSMKSRKEVAALERLLATVNDKRYGTSDDKGTWYIIKSAGEAFLNNIDQKSDRERGEELAELLKSAQRYLGTHSGRRFTQKGRDRVAFAKSVVNSVSEILKSFSMEERVMAVDAIYEKQNEVSEPGEAEAKELNKEFFAEYARDVARDQGQLQPGWESFITDKTFMFMHYNEKKACYAPYINKGDLTKGIMQLSKINITPAMLTPEYLDSHYLEMKPLADSISFMENSFKQKEEKYTSFSKERQDKLNTIFAVYKQISDYYTNVELKNCFKAESGLYLQEIPDYIKAKEDGVFERYEETIFMAIKKELENVNNSLEITEEDIETIRYIAYREEATAESERQGINITPKAVALSKMLRLVKTNSVTELNTPEGQAVEKACKEKGLDPQSAYFQKIRFVNYKDGKPATEEDEKNLAYNKAYAKSIIEGDAEEGVHLLKENCGYIADLISRVDFDRILDFDYWLNNKDLYITLCNFELNGMKTSENSLIQTGKKAMELFFNEKSPMMNLLNDFFGAFRMMHTLCGGPLGRALGLDEQGDYLKDKDSNYNVGDKSRIMDQVSEMQGFFEVAKKSNADYITMRNQYNKVRTEYEETHGEEIKAFEKKTGLKKNEPVWMDKYTRTVNFKTRDLVQKEYEDIKKSRISEKGNLTDELGGLLVEYGTFPGVEAEHIGLKLQEMIDNPKEFGISIEVQAETENLFKEIKKHLEEFIEYDTIQKIQEMVLRKGLLSDYKSGAVVDLSDYILIKYRRGIFLEDERKLFEIIGKYHLVPYAEGTTKEMIESYEKTVENVFLEAEKIGFALVEPIPIEKKENETTAERIEREYSLDNREVAVPLLRLADSTLLDEILSDEKRKAEFDKALKEWDLSIKQKNFCGSLKGNLLNSNKAINQLLEEKVGFKREVFKPTVGDKTINNFEAAMVLVKIKDSEYTAKYMEGYKTLSKILNIKYSLSQFEQYAKNYFDVFHLSAVKGDYKKAAEFLNDDYERAKIIYGKGSDDSDIIVKNTEMSYLFHQNENNKMQAGQGQEIKEADNTKKDNVSDTQYLKQTVGYKEVSKDEKLTDLQREFAEERYKRKKFFGGYKEDSAEMVEVKTRLAEMVDYLNEPVQIGLMADAAQILSNLYRELIRSCNDYLKGHGGKGTFTSTGTLRRQMVERILSSASKESALIVSIAKNTEESIKEEVISKNKIKNGEFVDGMTWENMLFECRARHYSKEKGDDIGVVGGGTSTIYVVKKENKNYFFKDKEDLKEDTIESKEKSALDNVVMQKSIGKISKEDATWVEEKIKKIGLSIKQDVKKKFMDESKASTLIESLRYFEKVYNDAKIDCQKMESEFGTELKLDTSYAFEFYINKVNKNYELNFSVDDYKSSNVLADIRSLFDEVLKDESKLSAIKIGFGALAKEYLAADILKNTVRLPKGASITNNNVATSRVADLLGISDVVCKSETTVLNVEGKTKIGNLMEGAEGGYIDDIKPSEQATAYSGKAKKQLLTLSVLDYIMGQTDRHDENYYVTHEKRENRMIITGIKGIDNDACCGMIQPKELEKVKGGWASLQRLTKGKTFNLPAIDYNFAKSIMALSPEVLQYELADLLLPEQILAMIERLSFIQSKVGEVIDLYEKEKDKDAINKKYKIQILETEDEWESLGSTDEEAERLQKYNFDLFRPGLELSTKADKAD